MIIRKATSADIPKIISLWKKSDLPMRSHGRDHPTNLAQQLKEANMWILLAEEENDLLGVVLVTHDSRKGWINRLAVAPSARRKGIATKLLHVAEESLDDVGIEVYAALIKQENAASRVLFKKCGYSYKEQVTYYSRKKSPEA
ncbi:MAG: GNAT family N-acetyltransferase [Candidatus Heimdallarchaeota archaeon]|nr:GNAT family N-acetyltransferase [Candidatus Heimdallarchaeota archaeon]